MHTLNRDNCFYRSRAMQKTINGVLMAYWGRKGLSRFRFNVVGLGHGITVLCSGTVWHFVNTKFFQPRMIPGARKSPFISGFQLLKPKLILS